MKHLNAYHIWDVCEFYGYIKSPAPAPQDMFWYWNVCFVFSAEKRMLPSNNLSQQEVHDLNKIVMNMHQPSDSDLRNRIEAETPMLQCKWRTFVVLKRL